MEKFRSRLASTLEWLNIGRFIPFDKRKTFMTKALPLIFMIAWFPVFSMIYSGILKWLFGGILQLEIPGTMLFVIAMIGSIATVLLVKKALKNTFMNTLPNQDMNIKKIK